MRRLAKALASILARVLVAPAAYPVAWLAPLDGRHALFQLGSHLMSLLPGLPGVYLRREYYKVVLGLRSKGFVIEFGTILAQRGTEIGSNVYIGPFCNIGLSAIEDDVLLGSNVDVVSGKHTHSFDRTDVPIREQEGVLKKIRIGRGSWIGNKSVVLETVGEGCVVGAGSVVTAETEPWVVLAGNPARPIRPRVRPSAAPSPRER
ncbi:MAG: acyltransferase [Planctomycetes bacterium]|nr:acyltransferase [Planctomycetota bacterium]